MCGIAGIVRWGAPADRNEVEAMTRAVAHRGPDGEGLFLRDGVALGHRRLAIIDLEGGQQPLSNETGSVWITYNGEIYNYRELRDELIAKGHTFKTRSDTEVVVHAYEQWGPAAVERFRGMFAFAIVDFDRRRCLLARDHFGIKPLFVRVGRNWIAFASELAALKCVKAPRSEIQPEAIDFYLRYNYVPGPGTIYRDVQQLPPATWLTFDLDNGRREQHTYWRLKFQPRRDRSLDQWLEEFDAVLADSVKAHLVADVPFGVFLSGGIDSTLVAGAMGDLLDRPVTAFSIGFDDEAFTELRYAEEAAKTLGIDLKTEIVTADVAHVLPGLIEHYGQPYADTSMIPTWYLSRLARRHVPLVLSGDGGDEAFAGYPRYACSLRDHWLYELFGILRRPTSFAWRGPRLWRRLIQTPANRLAIYEDWVGLVPREQRRQLWKPEFVELADRPCETFLGAFRRAASYDSLARVQSTDYDTYLPYDILTKVDVASMAHGLEVRPALIDVKVVELAAQMPIEARLGPNSRSPWTLRPRHEHSWTMKYIPKQSLRRRFPASFVDRPKMGFGIPEHRWLAAGTPVRALFDELVLDPKGRIQHWFRGDTLQSWANQIGSDTINGRTLWAILIFAMWLENT